MSNTQINDWLSPCLSAGQQQKLRRFLEQGLPLVARPYQQIAEQLNCSEAQILQCIEFWQQSNLIKRMGCVVNHRKLGYTANGMWVTNINDNRIHLLGKQLAKESCVTLCYQRPRRLPDWPYNLFCMIHGRSRHWVEQQVQRLSKKYQIAPEDQHLLFSTKAFKQRGGRYVSE